MEIAFDDFRNFLISNHIVDESKVAYYVNLVAWCLKASRKHFGDELTSTETNLFLRRLAKTKEHWQVDQAALSIRIYQYFIKTRKTAVHAVSIDDKQQWQYVANEMKNMLRLKQRAISTERTYLLWLRRFYRFVIRKNPDLSAGRLLKLTCPHLSEEECAAYAAPFPDIKFKAGVRRFPEIVPDRPDSLGA